MKTHPFVLGLLLLTFASPSFAASKKINTATRLNLVSKEMKEIGVCKNHFEPRDFHPTTVGKGTEKVSVLAFASNGNVMVGNDSKAFQLILDKGMIQSVNNGKVQKITYTVDPKTFLKQLTTMDTFLNQALNIAQKDKKDKDLEHIACAFAIVESAKKYHST